MPALLGAGASDEKRSAETYAALGPGKARFEQLDDEERLEFRDALTRFVRTYSFVSQIAAFTDPALERDYVYCRALSLYLRDTGTVERLDLGTEVELTHLRHQMTFSGTLVADLGGRRGPVVLRRGQGQPAGARPGAPLEHRRGSQRPLRDRPDRRRQAAVRPVRGELGRGRRAIGSGPEQQHRELPPGLRSQVPADHRHAHGRQRARSSRRSSTTMTSARLLGDFYLRKVYERLREGDSLSGGASSHAAEP